METRAEKLECEFDVFFESIQYQRVNKIVGDSPNFKNADYIHVGKKIIVELKILDKDFFNEGGIIHSLNTVAAIPKSINSEGEGFYEVKFPNENRHGIIDSIEEPLRLILKKANKQIKETKRELLNDKGDGFVMLAINLETSIDPTFIQALTVKLLKKEFYSISGVIFCTPKFGLIIDENFQPICLHCNYHKIPSESQNELFHIVNRWYNFIDNGGHD